MMWDFWSLSPESLHQVTILFSDRGTPDGYRHMDGFSSHTFSLINDKNELFYVKWHFKTKQGIKNFNAQSANEMRGIDPDYSQRDLFNAIKEGNFPKWTVSVQIMPEQQAETYHLNPFDLTKVWPHKDYPLHEVGELELNRNPENYFSEVEQAAFEPRNVVPGMGFSPDKMLQARLISYPDAHRYPPWRQLRFTSREQATVPVPYLQQRRRDAVRWKRWTECELRTEQLWRTHAGPEIRLSGQRW